MRSYLQGKLKMSEDFAPELNLVDLAADIVSAYVGNNTVAVADLLQ